MRPFGRRSETAAKLARNKRKKEKEKNEEQKHVSVFPFLHRVAEIPRKKNGISYLLKLLRSKLDQSSAIDLRY